MLCGQSVCVLAIHPTSALPDSHVNVTGGGPRNLFGTAFAATTPAHTWTKALCCADSDMDGFTNGFELVSAVSNMRETRGGSSSNDVRRGCVCCPCFQPHRRETSAACGASARFPPLPRTSGEGVRPGRRAASTDRGLLGAEVLCHLLCHLHYLLAISHPYYVLQQPRQQDVRPRHPQAQPRWLRRRQPLRRLPAPLNPFAI